MNIKLFHEGIVNQTAVLWLREDTPLPSNFNSMKNNDKWKYIENNNMLHKEDGPATLWEDGEKVWYIKGVQHRLDGPAVMLSNGEEYWFLNGLEVDGEIYQKIQNSSKEELLVYMINFEYKDYLPLIEYKLSL